MNKFIVITSIFNPTEAVIKFSKLTEYQLIVVGDKKTPDNWHCNNTKFLSIADQEEMDYTLASLLPFNHYSRKMIGYLDAIKNKADFIIDTDDDNIPKENWSFPEFNNDYQTVTQMVL